MGRLFLRIFASFAGGMVLIGIAIAGVTIWANQVSLEERLRGPERVFDAAGEALASGGEAGLVRWLRSQNPPGKRPTLLIIGADGRELLGRSIPRAWRRWLRRDGVMQGGRPNLRRPTLLPKLIGEAGREYTLIWLPRRGLPGPFPGLPFAWLAAILAVLAFVSWALARSVAKPVQSVQQAMTDLAHGNLNARVGTALAARRDELGTLAHNFDAMAARLQALVEERDTLLRDVSHELRSPLARQRVALGLAERRADPALAADLERIALEADRLDALIAEILALSRLRGAPSPQDNVDLAELVADTVADARFEAGDRPIVFDRPEAPTKVRGNADYLRRAIENVLRNALAYSPADKPITIEFEREAGMVSIVVRDLGPGVDPAALQDIFKPFFRASPSRERNSGGDGIGLAMTAEIMQLHGGSVRAENKSGGGLAVVIELPLP